MVVVFTVTTAWAETSEEASQREANFKAADRDGDGALSKAEFRTFIDANAEADLGQARRIQRIGAYDRAFGRLDADESGTVSWDEILKARAEAG